MDILNTHIEIHTPIQIRTFDSFSIEQECDFREDRMLCSVIRPRQRNTLLLQRLSQQLHNVVALVSPTHGIVWDVVRCLLQVEYICTWGR